MADKHELVGEGLRFFRSITSVTTVYAAPYKRRRETSPAVFEVMPRGSSNAPDRAETILCATGRVVSRTTHFWVTTLVILLVGLFSVRASVAATQGGPAKSVDPLIGTQRGIGLTSNMFPGPSLPFGMVQLSPDTETRGFGYHYNQPDIQGFSMTHMSGVGCSNEGDVFFTATNGPVGTSITQFESPYSHSQETASTGYYQVKLLRWGINAQLTATDRTGLARFTFPAGKVANILVPISHTLHSTVGAMVRLAGDREINGYVIDRSFCGGHQTYKVYFVMRFSRPFASFGTWSGNNTDGPGALSASSRAATQTERGQWVGAYASWPSSSISQTITVKVGISYVDLAGAENNLMQETNGKSFEAVRRAARAAWNKALSVIQVSGGTANNRRVFYTALYHSLLMPSTFSDEDGRYVGFESNKIYHVPPGHLVYCNFSGWDIYRSEMPLLALIEPKRMEDMAQSIVRMYQQGGWIGRWPQINLYTNVMLGSPLTTVLCMDWLDGLHGFDMKSAWEGMLRDATEAPPAGSPYAGERGITWINKIHYVPNNMGKPLSRGSVAKIQEDCIAYASLCRLAKNLGKTKDAKMFYQRALYYRNVYNPQDGFFRPRDSDGRWSPGFEPAKRSLNSGYTEGSAWHYRWLAPADLAWLVHAMGVNLFNQRLEEFFSYSKPGRYNQYYNPYNETDLEAPFEFNFSGKPWESQRVVRRLLHDNYTTSPNGLPGNDDCGAMSSWAVLSMMGIYTVDPASLAYELVSPVFQKIVIHLHAPYRGKTFNIVTSGKPETKTYIQRVKLNGQLRAKNWIPFGDITSGGTLQFMLGPLPNTAWGSATNDAPPSLSDGQP